MNIYWAGILGYIKNKQEKQRNIGLELSEKILEKIVTSEIGLEV